MPVFNMLKNIVFLLALAVFSTPAAAVSLSHTTPEVKISLLSDTPQINPDQDLKILIKFDISPGWHILSPSPGEIGLPTTIDWKLPQSRQLTETLWSRSKEFNDEGLSQYIYEKEAYYLATLSPSEISADSRTASFSAEISWQACADECLPAKHTFNFTLPLTNEKLSPSEKWRMALKQAQKTFRTSQEKIPAQIPELKLWLILLMAFTGGLILNLMPCIFPVLSLKAIAVVKSAKHKRKLRSDALLYTAGVLASFGAIAFILVSLRENGEKVGWGFQMQSPVFVAVLLGIFIAILLMFLDIIKVSNPFSDPMVRLSVKARKLSSFLTGAFSVLIATPCTAPFMGIAVGYTLTRPVSSCYPVFFMLGLGYAFPFLLLGFFPKILAGILPKPGKWMITLKRIFAIPVFLTCIWLGWILYGQLSGRPAPDEQGLLWHPYDAGKINEAMEKEQKIFIDFTAKWCLTCLANEKNALDTEEFAQIVKEKNIILFKADWTKHDPLITQALENYNRSSIPLYVYHDGSDTHILPQILTPGIIRDFLK